LRSEQDGGGGAARSRCAWMACCRRLHSTGYMQSRRQQSQQILQASVEKSQSECQANVDVELFLSKRGNFTPVARANYAFRLEPPSYLAHHYLQWLALPCTLEPTSKTSALTTRKMSVTARASAADGKMWINTPPVALRVDLQIGPPYMCICRPSNLAKVR
jgi:hypothetical protein